MNRREFIKAMLSAVVGAVAKMSTGDKPIVDERDDEYWNNHGDGEFDIDDYDACQGNCNVCPLYGVSCIEPEWLDGIEFSLEDENRSSYYTSDPYLFDSRFSTTRLEQVAQSLSNVAHQAKSTSQVFDDFVKATVRSTKKLAGEYERMVDFVENYDGEVEQAFAMWADAMGREPLTRAEKQQALLNYVIEKCESEQA